jgi:hypothetical protein
MNISALQYSTFNESYFERIFTKALSVPPIGTIIRSFFYRKTISMYANLLLEVSGFQEYIEGLSINEAKAFIIRFTKIQNVMLALQNSIPQSANNQEFMEIVRNINAKLSDNIELLEDAVNHDYAYQISVNYEDNDWNDPLNDHWDNY